ARKGGREQGYGPEARRATSRCRPPFGDIRANESGGPRAHGASGRLRQHAVGVSTSRREQRCTGRRRRAGVRASRLAQDALAEREGGVAGGPVHTATGACSGHSEAYGRDEDIGRADGRGSVGSAGAAPSAATVIRADVLGRKLRLPARAQRSSSGAAGASVHLRGKALGGGPRSGEVLRSSQSRRADGAGGAPGER